MLQTSDWEDDTFKGEHEPKDEKKENDINFICEQARRNAVHVIWPGLLLSTYCFAFFLFDMAHDDDEDSLSTPVGLLCSLVAVAHVSRFVYYYNRHKLKEEVISRVNDLNESSVSVSNNGTRHDDETFGQLLEDGTLQSLKNPLLSGDTM